MHRANWNNTWPLERILFALAGTVLLISIVLTISVSQWFLLLTGFVAINQLLYASVGACGASLVIARTTGARSTCASSESAR